MKYLFIIEDVTATEAIRTHQNRVLSVRLDQNLIEKKSGSKQCPS